ncbi:MAG: hypothetical protein LBH13_09415 [Cellulomonadaceae bacterium]|jgi:hypothetical protein|nr:hypothetical protein [Cellulomonadaceae bacterium]
MSEADDRKRNTCDDDGAQSITEQFNAIVAELDDMAVPEERGREPRAPVHGLLAPLPGPHSGPLTGAVTDPRSGPLAGPRDWPVTPEVEALEDDETRFVPPDPGPVVEGRDPLLVLAWTCVVGVPVLGIVWLMVRAAGHGHLPGFWGIGGAVVFVASLGVLIWRMPHQHDSDSHDDTGAVV